jgi:peptide/nickel transport system permease protein
LIGVISALKQYSITDHLASGLAFLGLSMPTFWFALILIVLTGTFWESHTHSANPLLPGGGLYTPGHLGFSFTDRAKHLILPAIVLMVQIVAEYSRYMRTNMLEVLSSDYLRTARAKGISERRVVVRHAMRNALIPLATFSAIDIGAIAGGLIVTEYVFSYPGMGQYFLSAFQTGDYPEVLPWMMIVMIFVIVFNLLADLSYAWLDPRIRID